MAPPIQVTFRRFEPTDAIRDKINSLMRQFDKYESSIIFGDVVVEAVGGKGEKTEVEIRVELDLPRGKAVAKRGADIPMPAGKRSFDTAATEAFRAALDQVKRHFDKMHTHETKNLDHQPAYGRIERLNPDDRNGFVEMPDGISLFFADDVVQGQFDELSVGDQVLATPADAEGPYGPQASTVKPIGPIASRG